jgi:holo-ACP synthase
MIVTLTELLDRREERSKKRKILLSRYGGNLITFHLNIPGPEKNKLLYKVTLIEGQKAFINFLKRKHEKPIYDAIEFHNTGPEGLMIVKGLPETLKRLLVEFESHHPLGRIFDLDLYTGLGQFSRSDLNLEERRCYVCDDLAKVCARSKRHDINVIIKKLDSMMTTFHTSESQGEI